MAYMSPTIVPQANSNGDLPRVVGTVANRCARGTVFTAMIDPKKERRWIERRRPSLVLALRERDGEMCLLCGNPLDGEPFADMVAYWLDRGSSLDGEICFGCNERMPHDGGQLHIDHIVSLSEGGTNDPDNLCLIHKCCNLTKETFMSTTWFEERVREHRKTRPIMRFTDRSCRVIYPNGDRSIYTDLTSSRWRE